LRAIKIGASKPLKRWSDEEDEVIRNSHGKLQLQDVARTLNRRISEVSTRSKALGLGTWRKERSGFHSGRPVDGFKKQRPVYSHRRVVEEMLGRSLRSDEIVHHIDFDKQNNAPSNLYLFESRAAHRRSHMSFEWLVPSLVKSGIIFFNVQSGSYELCKTSK
jgi:hypothetical protein